MLIFNNCSIVMLFVSVFDECFCLLLFKSLLYVSYVMYVLDSGKIRWLSFNKLIKLEMIFQPVSVLAAVVSQPSLTHQNGYLNVTCKFWCKGTALCGQCRAGRRCHGSSWWPSARIFGKPDTQMQQRTSSPSDHLLMQASLGQKFFVTVWMRTG